MFHFVLGAVVGLPVGFVLSVAFPGITSKLRYVFLSKAEKIREVV